MSNQSVMQALPPASPSPNSIPPFRGLIETTYDALLVFEAARRGMIPRICRRLQDPERVMVQSGAVFVFDETESGIRRWTDGLIWSPSRILGNFLVYREIDKKSGNPPTSSDPSTNSSPENQNPMQLPESSSMGMDMQDLSRPLSSAGVPVLGGGALNRPRSAIDGRRMTRDRERQLVGSLTNSTVFKEGGLVKKTMSVTINNYAQHMVSYYTIEDVLQGRLRTPSSIPELAALDISEEYLHRSNFRFPPQVEAGPDGITRYRGEPEDPSSPTSPTSPNAMFPSDGYTPKPAPLQLPSIQHSTPRMDSPGLPRQRSVTVPMTIPVTSPPVHNAYMEPSSAGSAYLESMAPPLIRQSSASSITGTVRPGSSSSRRYDPYGQGGFPVSPRSAGMSYPAHRRQSQPIYPGNGGEYYPASPYDSRPATSYHYQPPNTASGPFPEYYSNGPSQPSPSPVLSPTSYTPTMNYASWQPHPPPLESQSRLMPTPRNGNGNEYGNTPSSAGSSVGPEAMHSGWGHPTGMEGGRGTWEGPPQAGGPAY